VTRVVGRLAAAHGSADLGNRQDPIEELVWICLTRQTHYQNSLRSWQRIVELGGPAALLEIPEEQLAELIKDAGFSHQKARWIKSSLAMIVELFGSLSLADTIGWSDDETEAYLASLPGLSIKSAKCVMMYSLGRQVLPVDTHLRRLAERLGWVAAGLSEPRIHHELESLIPPDERHSLHVNAIWHGRSICRALRPRCCDCVIKDDCRFPSDG
jgi:endonuclease III